MHSISSRTPSLLAAALCGGSGLCVSFCFWPYHTGFLAYFILIPFIIFSGIIDGKGRYLINSYLFGFGYFFGSLYWIAMLTREQITIPGLRLPAAIVLCLYLSLFMLLTGFLARRLVLIRIPFEIGLALAWAGAEYLRSLGVLGFPWASLGYSQTPYPPVIQQAAVTGTYGISLWLVLINGLLARFILTGRRTALVAAAVTFAIPMIGGCYLLGDTEHKEGVRLSLIQPNISGSVKWDRQYRDSTMTILSQMTADSPDVEMIVWPETAVPFYVKHMRSSLEHIRELARSVGSHIIFGFPDYESGDEQTTFYNSAMHINPDGEVSTEYRKIHLVPFGEKIPFEDHITILKRIDLGEGDFSPGDRYQLFEIDGREFSVAICFESIYPSLVREFVRQGASFVINITNDEWFGPSIGPHQHAQMAVMRAVECRVGLARCANTGLSMFVDPYGRITARTSLFAKRILVGEVAVGRGSTPYLKMGGFFEIALLLALLLLASITYIPGLASPK